MNNQGTHQTSSLTSMDPLHTPLTPWDPLSAPPYPLGPLNIPIGPLGPSVDRSRSPVLHCKLDVALDLMISRDACLDPLSRPPWSPGIPYSTLWTSLLTDPQTKPDYQVTSWSLRILQSFPLILFKAYHAVHFISRTFLGQFCLVEKTLKKFFVPAILNIFTQSFFTPISLVKVFALIWVKELHFLRISKFHLFY